MMKKIAAVFQRDSKKSIAARVTEFLPAVLEVTETPPSPIGRTVMWTLALLVTGCVIWAIFGYVDEVAVATGKIIPNGFTKTVQAEDKGTVKAIHVKDGQKVHKGDLLIELNPTLTAADLALTKKELAYYNLEVERLTAEKTESAFLPVQQPDLDEKALEYQTKLYTSRTTEYHSKVDGAKASINQAEASLNIAKVNKVKLAEQYAIAKDRENRAHELVEQEAIGLFMFLDYQSKRIDYEQGLAAQIAEIARLESALVQSRQNLSTIEAERNRDIDEKMVDARKKVSSYTEDLKKAEEKDRYSRILAPVDGIVTQLAIHTVGGVVTQAQALMAIVPEEGELEVETWAANKDIGFIQVGQKAEIKVETFNFQKFGTFDAEVMEISPDAIEDKDKGRVYRVALKLDKNDVFVNNKPVSLTPGMSVTAEIKLRQKRIIEFFLDPFKKYKSEGLRER